MAVVFLILLLLGALCFLVQASGRVASRVDLVALGLLFWIAVPLVQAFQGLAH
jgi:hypothetical protein